MITDLLRKKNFKTKEQILAGEGDNQDISYDNSDEGPEDDEKTKEQRSLDNLSHGFANPPSTSDLRGDLNEALPSFMSHKNNVSKWLGLRSPEVKNKVKGRSSVSPKVVRKQNEWRYASLSEPLLASRDMFDVTPVTGQDVKSAKNNALILNQQFRRDIKRVDFIDEYVRTVVDEGTVIVRVGWEFIEKDVEHLVNITEKDLPVEIKEQLDQMGQAVQSGEMDPQEFMVAIQQASQFEYDKQTENFEKKRESVVLSNKPTLDICAYDSFIIDPSCNGDIDNARFVIYRFTSSIAELNSDERYENIELITESDRTIDSSGISRLGDNAEFSFKDKPRKRLDVYEYWGEWDIHNNDTTVPIVATFVGDVMIRLEENPFPDKKPPFVKVRYMIDRQDVYGGEPDAVLIEENQAIIGAITRGSIDLLARSANSQTGIALDAIPATELVKFEGGSDYFFNSHKDPREAFYTHKYPELPNSALQMINMQTSDAESLTGIRSFGSSSGTLGNTATEQRGALDATSKREMAILRRLTSGLVLIGIKIAEMNAVNLSDEEIVRITDEEFVSISRDSLEGRHDISMTVETPDIEIEKAQDLNFMLQTVGPSMDPGLVSIIMAKTATLKNMPDLADSFLNYSPEPDPKQEKIKDLEIQLLEAKVANEASKAKENEGDMIEKLSQAELARAKAGTELAKAEALKSSKELNDLTFVERVEGTDVDKESKMRKQQLAGEMEKKSLDYLLGIGSEAEAESKATHMSGVAKDKNTITSDVPGTGSKSIDGISSPQDNLSDELR